MSFWAALGSLVLGTAMDARADREAEEALNQSAAEAEAAGEFQAIQLERKAGEERAIGIWEASELAREGRLLKSRAKTIAGASGAGGADFTDIEVQTEKNVLMSMYNSELSARDLEVAAEVSRREGADAARADIASASAVRSKTRARTVQTAGQVGMSLYERYGNRTGSTTSAEI